MTRAENLALAAEHSRGCLRQWLRYLGKEFEGGGCRLTDDQIAEILQSDELDMVQKIAFREAMKDGTAINRYVISLSQPAGTPLVDELLKGLK